MGMRIPPLKLKILLESNPQRSRILERRLAATAVHSLGSAHVRRMIPHDSVRVLAALMSDIGAQLVSCKRPSRPRLMPPTPTERLAEHGWKPHREFLARKQLLIAGLNSTAVCVNNIGVRFSCVTQQLVPSGRLGNRGDEMAGHASRRPWGRVWCTVVV